MLTLKKGDLDKPRSYMRIYDGEKLIHDFVICRNPEGKIGVYDLVNDKFLEFYNCVEVREGDRIILYTESEYANSISLDYYPMIGDMYIDTGIKPDYLKGD